MRTNTKLKTRGYADRGPRVSVTCNAVLTESDGCALPVVITDVSRDGFRVQSRAMLEAGSDVTLQVAKLAPVRAVIRWTREFEAGGVFLDPAAL